MSLLLKASRYRKMKIKGNKLDTLFKMKRKAYNQKCGRVKNKFVLKIYNAILQMVSVLFLRIISGIKVYVKSYVNIILFL